MLQITLTRGLVAKTGAQRRVVQALGLTKQGSSVVRADSPTIRGMLNKVHHLVNVQPLAEAKVGDLKKSKKAK